jgi:hypothetical protein
MSLPESIDEFALKCPKCGEPLYVRYTQGGPLDREQAKHMVVNMVWTAECHNDACKWESPKRGTDWALIRTVLNTTSD